MSLPTHRWRTTVAIVAAGIATVMISACSDDGDDTNTAAGGPAAQPEQTTSPSEGAPSEDSSSPFGPDQTGSMSQPTKPNDSPKPSTSPGPGEGPDHGDQSGVLETLPGSQGPGCVAVRNQMTVRAGGLAMGNFQQARQQFRAGQEDNSLYFYVIPRHAGSMQGAYVRASQPGAAPATYESTSTSSANEWKYYAINVSITSPGTWTFRVSADQDRGCFVVDF